MSFPDHAPPLECLINNCCNVTELSLPTAKLDPEQLVKVTDNLKRLQKLDIQWSTNLMPVNSDMIPMLVISSKLKELTIRMEPWEIFDKQLEKFKLSLNAFLHNWALKDFIPRKLNIVGVQLFENDLRLLHGIGSLPSGQNAYLKVYGSLKAPLDLFPILPVYRWRFGSTAEPPYVNACKFGLEQHGSTLCVTDCSDGKTVLYRAPLCPCCSVKNYHINTLNYDAFSLNFVVEFDLSYCQFLTSDHLEQLATVCLSLQRLQLFRSVNCLKKLQGLRTIASCCHSLQGLGLVGISVTKVENHIQLWEILSSLKLTHLAIGLCNMLPFEGGDAYKNNLIKLYQKCLSLQALHFESCLCGYGGNCASCTYFNYNQLFLLSYFPSLAYCLLMEFHVLYLLCYNTLPPVVRKSNALSFLNHL